MNVTVTGDVQFTTDPKRIAAEIGDAIFGDDGSFSRDFLDVAVEVAADAAPVDSGNLKRSINWEKAPGVGMVFLFQTRTADTDPNGVGYGAWQELGTARMEGKAFMAQGWQAAVDQFSRSL